MEGNMYVRVSKILCTYIGAKCFFFTTGRARKSRSLILRSMESYSTVRANGDKIDRETIVERLVYGNVRERHRMRESSYYRSTVVDKPQA